MSHRKLQAYYDLTAVTQALKWGYDSKFMKCHLLIVIEKQQRINYKERNKTKILKNIKESVWS